MEKLEQTNVWLLNNNQIIWIIADADHLKHTQIGYEIDDIDWEIPINDSVKRYLFPV